MTTQAVSGSAHDDNAPGVLRMIEVEGITKTYGQVRAVDGISSTAADGRVTGSSAPTGGKVHDDAHDGWAGKAGRRHVHGGRKQP